MSAVLSVGQEILVPIALAERFTPEWKVLVIDGSNRAEKKTRVVISCKLIARDTVEERIRNLQKRKRELASAMLETEEPLLAGLTTADLEELLTP